MGWKKKSHLEIWLDNPRAHLALDGLALTTFLLLLLQVLYKVLCSPHVNVYIQVNFSTFSEKEKYQMIRKSVKACAQKVPSHLAKLDFQ